MALLDFSVHKGRKYFILTLVLTAVYLIISVPFKVMEIIPGFTDIRPVTMLQPIYGVFFGIPGCLAFGIGNLITDALSDSLRWSSIAGFIANFIGPFCFYIYCKKICKEPYNLRTSKNLLIHIFIILFSAVLETLIITPMVMIFYPEVSYLTFSVSVMLNQTVFPILIGIPLIILMQEELGFKPLHRQLS